MLSCVVLVFFIFLLLLGGGFLVPVTVGCTFCLCGFLLGDLCCVWSQSTVFDAFGQTTVVRLEVTVTYFSVCFCVCQVFCCLFCKLVCVCVVLLGFCVYVCIHFVSVLCSVCVVFVNRFVCGLGCAFVWVSVSVLRVWYDCVLVIDRKDVMPFHF